MDFDKQWHAVKRVIVRLGILKMTASGYNSIMYLERPDATLKSDM